MKTRTMIFSLVAVLLPLALFAQQLVHAPRPSLPAGDTKPAMLATCADENASAPQEGQVDEFPRPLKRVDPWYPELAQKAGIEGKVFVQIAIDTTGKVTEVKVLKSDNEVFNEAALQAARQWTFTPAMKDQQKIPLIVTLPFAFKLSDKMKEDGAKGKEASALPRTVRTLLAGSDDADARGCILPDAYLIDGPLQVNLLEALSGRSKAAVFSTEQSRSIATIRLNMNDEMTAAFVVAMTEGANKSAPRWHTIVWRKNKEGKWKIQHWHTSR